MSLLSFIAMLACNERDRRQNKPAPDELVEVDCVVLQVVWTGLPNEGAKDARSGEIVGAVGRWETRAGL